MSQLISQLSQVLQQTAESVPLEVFVVIGSFVEEIIAPIPSPLVMTLAGSLAKAQMKPLISLLFIAVIGAAAKTFGSLILYVIADKLEDVVLGKMGKFFGITHKEIEQLGKKLNGGPRDDILIFLARAIPIVPTAPVSIVSGLIKVKMKTYLVSSFLGTIVRNLFYLYLGYVGLAGYETIMGQFESVEKIVTVTLGLALIGGMTLIWYGKNKDKLFEKLQKATLEQKTKK